MNRRGAVFLLGVYVIAVALVVLSGVAIQRTLVDIRSAEVSRERQQAFWVAEAGLEQALATLRNNPGIPAEQTVISGSALDGTYTYTVTRLTGQPSWDEARMANVYEITATGTTPSTTTPARLQATVSFDRQMVGMWANKSIYTEEGFWGAGFHLHPIDIKGDVRAAGGKPRTVDLAAGVTVDGAVTINSPDVAGGWTRLYGPNERTDGIIVDPEYEWDGWDRLPAAEATEGYSQRSLARFPPLDPPEECSASSWWIIEEHYHLRDGDPMDQSPAGDGKVLVCVPSVFIDEQSRLVVHDPTVLYVTRTNTVGQAFTNDGVIDVVAGLQRRPERGLTLVVTAPPTPQRQIPGGWAHEPEVLAGSFEGSIYAPQSEVSLETSFTESWNDSQPRRRRLGYLVANKVKVLGVPIEFNHRTARRRFGDDPSPSPAVILQWNNFTGE